MGKAEYTPKSNYHGGKKNLECYFCGCVPPLREHHVIPRRFDGPDTEENIVELCDLCHKRIERLYDKSFYEWFGIKDEKGERKYHRQCDAVSCDNRRKVKITRKLGQLRIRLDGNNGFKAYRGDIISVEPSFYFACRPCAAQLARKAFNELWWLYDSDKRKLHERARFLWEDDRYEFISSNNSFDSRSGYWAHKKSRHECNQQPPWPKKPKFDSPEEVMEEIITEEADD